MGWGQPTLHFCASEPKTVCHGPPSSVGCAAMIRPSRVCHAAVLVFLFVSGMAGLIYEIVWARYLALFLGHSSYAVIMVLATFMGGLALGNFWIGKLADRIASPLAFYGWLEIGIGGYGLIFPAYYSLSHQAFILTGGALPPGGAALLTLKFGFS